MTNIGKAEAIAFAKSLYKEHRGGGATYIELCADSVQNKGLHCVIGEWFVYATGGDIPINTDSCIYGLTSLAIIQENKTRAQSRAQFSAELEALVKINDHLQFRRGDDEVQTYLDRAYAVQQKIIEIAENYLV